MGSSMAVPGWPLHSCALWPHIIVGVSKGLSLLLRAGPCARCCAGPCPPDKLEESVSPTLLLSVLVHGNSPCQALPQLGTWTHRVYRQWAPRMLSSLLASTVSAQTSHTTLTCTPLLLHTYSPCTPPPPCTSHSHAVSPVLPFPQAIHVHCQRTPLPDSCSHPQAQAHPLATLAHTPRPARIQMLLHTAHTPRALFSGPIQTRSELRCLTFLHVCIISVHAYLGTPSRPRSTRGYECLHSAPSGTCVHTHICSLSFLCAYYVRTLIRTPPRTLT